MAKIWYIHREGASEGPYSSEEIRQALREGTIDAFDFVSRKGSEIRLEIVEVDEIFKTDITFIEEQTQVSQESYPVEALKVSGRVAPQSASSSTRISPSPANERHSRKHKAYNAQKFFVVSKKGHKLGPLSALQIQSMYFKGRIPSNSMILKIDSNVKVPINRFMKVYRRGRSAPNIKMAPPSPVMKLARLSRGTHYGFKHMILLGLLLFTTVFFSTMYFMEKNSNQSPKGEPSHSSALRKGSDSRKMPQSDSRPLPPPKKQTNLTKRLSPTKALPQSSITPSRKTKPATQTIRAPSRTFSPPQRLKPSPAKSSAKATANRASPPISRHQNSPNPIRDLKPGQIVQRLGPFDFNKSAVTSCQNRCEIIFTNTYGIVRGKFFKQHWGKALMQRGGRVYISGLVQRANNGIVVLINDIE